MRHRLKSRQTETNSAHTARIHTCTWSHPNARIRCFQPSATLLMFQNQTITGERHPCWWLSVEGTLLQSGKFQAPSVRSSECVSASADCLDLWRMDSSWVSSNSNRPGFDILLILGERLCVSLSGNNNNNNNSYNKEWSQNKTFVWNAATIHARVDVSGDVSCSRYTFSMHQASQVHRRADYAGAGAAGPARSVEWSREQQAATTNPSVRIEYKSTWCRVLGMLNRKHIVCVYSVYNMIEQVDTVSVV